MRFISVSSFKITAIDPKGRKTVNAEIHLSEETFESELRKIISDLLDLQVEIKSGEEVPLKDCKFFVNGKEFQY